MLRLVIEYPMLSTIAYRTKPTRSSAPSLGRDAAGISVRHQLLSGSSRAAAVHRLESAIDRLNADPNITTPCEVVLFEIEGDDSLHCNVTHERPTGPIAGWAGPGRVAGGFVYNRRFLDVRHTDVIRHIRDIVRAPRA